jgi:cytochrome c biogenesis protein
MKAFLDYFSSVKLAIVLLIIITLASILGTLVPQHRTSAEYATRYGQLAPLLITLEVTRLYHSWWFLGLLFLFALNTAVCTLTRLGTKWRRAFRPRIKTGSGKIRALAISTDIQKKGTLAETAERVTKALSARRFRIQETQDGGTVDFLARKRTLGVFGSDIVHLGLLVILAGGIISGFTSTRRMLTITEGETLEVPEAGIELRLDEFQTEYYPNGQVKDWKSYLTVIQGGEEVKNQMIEVNHPLSYRGFVYYQSSYGYDWQNPHFEIWVKKAGEEEVLDKLQAGVSERIKLSDGATEIIVRNFVPDFIIGENNEVATRSLQPNNPAVLIEGYQRGERLLAAWVFSKFPDFNQMHSDKEHKFAFELKNIESAPYSGIEMARDPGVNFIWAGCIFLTLGLFVAFFWTPAEIRVSLARDAEGRTSITAGGVAAKNKEALKTEFETMIDELRSKP